ncbi:MAG: hypothetical protein NC452_10295 [Eubacterium sp.]|nr:hypothetical protein [Eubacterium sp.]
MTVEIIFSNLSVILASALGAGIGSFFAFKIAVYQITLGKKTELEKTINPFLFEMRLQFEKAKAIHDAICSLKSRPVKPEDWETACINIIKNEKYRIDDSYPNWIRVRSEVYMYSYAKNNSDTLFQVIEELATKFHYLSKAQNVAEEHFAKDITCSWIEEEYIKIVQIVNKIADKDIKDKFFYLSAENCYI